MAVTENYAGNAVMAELDENVSVFWKAALAHPDALCELIEQFDPTAENIRLALASQSCLVHRGFATLLMNRVRHGGILAEGASNISAGDGNGITSRWYPQTLMHRIRAIKEIAHRITFCAADGLALLSEAASGQDVVAFCDPPYANAGKRLYKHHRIDHAALFDILAEAQDMDFLMTYDDTPEIADMVLRHGLCAARVRMRTTGHISKHELVITRRPVFE